MYYTAATARRDRSVASCVVASREAGRPMGRALFAASALCGATAGNLSSMPALARTTSRCPPGALGAVAPTEWGLRQSGATCVEIPVSWCRPCDHGGHRTAGVSAGVRAFDYWQAEKLCFQTLVAARVPMGVSPRAATSEGTWPANTCHWLGAGGCGFGRAKVPCWLMTPGGGAASRPGRRQLA